MSLCSPKSLSGRKSLLRNEVCRKWWLSGERVDDVISGLASFQAVAGVAEEDPHTAADSVFVSGCIEEHVVTA